MLRFGKLLLCVSASIATVATAQNTTSTANLTVALVRAPPPDWPLPVYTYDWTGVMPTINSSIDQGIKYIQKAKADGANWIVFPELWFPGYVDYLSLVPSSQC